MKVRELMSRQLISITPEESTAVAARLLSRYNIGALPVCSAEGKLRGMVTDRDIALRCVAAQEDPERLRVGEIMTRRVFAIDAEQSVSAASELMAQEQIRRLPVQREGKIVGMVSLADLSREPACRDESSRILSSVSRNVRTM